LLKNLSNRISTESKQTISTEPLTAPILSDLPTSWDWRTKGVVGPIETQGQCGSTWALVAKETFESVCAVAGYPLEDLSTQQIVDCDTVDQGCDGGEVQDANNYIIQAGLETEKSYPYTSEDGTCKYKVSEVVKCKMTKWEWVTQTKNETKMQEFIYKNSPISVCVDAEAFIYYDSGVITTKSGCGTSIDHCLELVGWVEMNGMEAWILRNAWGWNWGMNGYVYIEIGYNICGIAEMPIACCVNSPTGNQVC